MAKKRANGEGSIRKKPSGRWEGRYTQGIDPVTGRAIQKSVSAKTQAECKEKLAKAIRENRGVPLNHTGDYTAAEWCRLWFETYSKPNIRYNTAKGYEGIIEHHIIPAIGAIKLKQLSSIHIQRMYNETKENGRIPVGFQRQRDERRGVDLGVLCQTHLVLVERFAVWEVFDQFGDELLLLSCGRTVIWDKFHPLPGRDVAKVSGGSAGAFDIGTLEDQSCHSSSSQSGS